MNKASNSSNERQIKKTMKEIEIHKANIMKVENLIPSQDYMIHNRSMRNSIFWILSHCKEGRAMMERQYVWPKTVFIHNGIEYSFEITAECNGYLKVYRKVYRNGKKTNSGVIRTLLEKHFAAVEYLTRAGLSLPSIYHQIPAYYNDRLQRRVIACSAVKSISEARNSYYPSIRPHAIRKFVPEQQSTLNPSKSLVPENIIVGIAENNPYNISTAVQTPLLKACIMNDIASYEASRRVLPDLKNINMDTSTFTLQGVQYQFQEGSQYDKI